MSDVTDVCRRTWRQLGVPREAVSELAAELDADLADAAADGVSADAYVGQDPELFARRWAIERGLARPRLRLVTTALAAVLGAIPGASFGLFAVYGLSSEAFGRTFGEDVRVSVDNWAPYFEPPGWLILTLYSLAGLFAAAGALLAARAVLTLQRDLAVARTTRLLTWCTLPAIGAAVTATVSFSWYYGFGDDRATVVGDAVVAIAVFAAVMAAVRLLAVLQVRREGSSMESSDAWTV